jgi:hypothetical protein
MKNNFSRIGVFFSFLLYEKRNELIKGKEQNNEQLELAT